MVSKRDFMYLAGLVLITTILWLPTKNVPYWWDSAGFVVQSAYRFLETNFQPITSEFTDFAHPTLFIILLAFLWKIFGESLLVSHILNLLFTIVAVTGMYSVGRELFPKSHVTSFVGALLLLVSPVFLAQVGIVYMEIPLVGLLLWSYYFFLKRRYAWFSLVASLAVLMKETGILFVCILLVVYLISDRRARKKSRFIFRETVFLALPIGVLLLWFFYHWYTTGWWFVSPNAEHVGVTTAAVDWNNAGTAVTFSFIQQWRFVLLLLPACLLSVYAVQVPQFLKKLQKLWSIRTLPLIITPVIYTLFFAKTTFLPRYSIIVLPFFYLASLLLSLHVAEILFSKRKAFVVLIPVLVLLIAFISGWNNQTKYTRFVFSKLESNLEYMDIIAAGQKLSDYVATHHAKDVIYSSFPVNYMLNQPGQHYIASPVTVKECKDYTDKDPIGGIVVHLYSPGQLQCTALLRKLQLRKYVVFEEKNKRFVLFTR